jgi:hypothetical protein
MCEQRKVFEQPKDVPRRKHVLRKIVPLSALPVGHPLKKAIGHRPLLHRLAADTAEPHAAFAAAEAGKTGSRRAPAVRTTATQFRSITSLFDPLAFDGFPRKTIFPSVRLRPDETTRNTGANGRMPIAAGMSARNKSDWT